MPSLRLLYLAQSRSSPFEVARYARKRSGLPLNRDLWRIPATSLSPNQLPPTCGNNMLTITYKGATKTISEWSQITGLSEQVLRRRVVRPGWTPEDVIEKPLVKPPSKNDAELFLNDQPLEALPPQFIKIIKNRKGHAKKYGSYIRSDHRKLFDKWFAEEWAPAQDEGPSVHQIHADTSTAIRAVL